MKKNKTEIVIILDRSGSMANMKSDMEEGLKSYINKQKKVKGECSITFYKFDNEIDKVFEDKDISEVRNITLEPRGSTSLFDTLGTAINEVGARLANTKESERPSLVLWLVLTDGLENSSKEFNREQVRKMIKHQESKFNWQFVYLGANQDAFAAGQDYGFMGGKSMTYNKAGVKNVFNSLDIGTTVMRCDTDNAAAYSFSTSDRKEALIE